MVQLSGKTGPSVRHGLFETAATDLVSRPVLVKVKIAERQVIFNRIRKIAGESTETRLDWFPSAGGTSPSLNAQPARLT